VSLPELPLLGVLPGTGGLTRVVDKRHVRRDLADYFSTRAEGIGGKKALDWRLVDEVVPRALWDNRVAERAVAAAAASGRAADGASGIRLTPLEKTRSDEEISYRWVSARLDRQRSVAEITVRGPAGDAPATMAEVHDLGDQFWALAMARELDDLILDLRTNETEIGTWLLRTEGEAGRVLAHDELLLGAGGQPGIAADWLAREIVLYLKRTLKRLDVTSRSLIALIEPGSCFAGSLLELALAADRSYMLTGVFEDVAPDADPAAITVGPANLGPLPMGNGLTRLQTRFLGDDAALRDADKEAGQPLAADDAARLGLITFAPDDIDWADEVRIAVEERASFSPDGLTGLEANYRFAGPETIETKIFGRLSAWQNWIFYRPNASGPDGALRAYGTGKRASFDRKRV
jgi:benzoyl-CoA-dihydrodiol lyase